MLTILKRLRETNTEEGFTLTELMIIVFIIGVLAAITIPIFTNQQHQAQVAAVKTDIKNTALAVQTFQAKYGKYPQYVSDIIKMGVSISDKGNYTTTTNNYLICLSVNLHKYAVLAQAADGTVVKYSSETGKLAVEPNGTWNGSRGVMCETVGFTEATDTPGVLKFWVYNSGNNGWGDWVST